MMGEKEEKFRLSLRPHHLLVGLGKGLWPTFFGHLDEHGAHVQGW